MKMKKKVVKRLPRRSQLSSNSSTTPTRRVSLPLDVLDDLAMFDLLRWAIQRKPIEVVKSLVEQGANVNAKSPFSGMTPLHYAAMGNSLEKVQYLISQGANIQAIDQRGRTPLHCTVEARNGVEIRPEL